MLDEKEFNKMNTAQRFERLKKEGHHLASRFFTDYNVHLCYDEPFYIEIWYKMGFDMIYWIEIVKNKDILDTYTDLVDIHKNLKD
jgi:hypothetical protein